MAHLQDYLLNAPIGYSKKPLMVRPSVLRPERELQTPSPKPGNHVFERLPPEIAAHIAKMLNQHDTLSLAYTCRKMAALCLDRIYEKVVVDSHYTQFSKEYPAHVTYINLLYSFKKFIRQKRGHVRALHVVSLPDLTNLYDADVSTLLHAFFALLLALHELVWVLDNFRLEYLRKLPNHKLLTRLELNVKYSNYLGELGAAKVDESEYMFPNLVSFHIRPFLNLRRLAKLLHNLLVAQNAEHVRQNLRSFKLARFDHDTTVLVPPARELISSALTADEVHEYELDTISTVFLKSKVGRFSALTELLLNNMLVRASDAQTLVSGVDLQKLRRFELKNVSEYGQADEQSASGGFLLQLGPYLQDLAELRLDFREASHDTVAPFLRSLGELRALDVVIRLNDMKIARVNLDSMYQEYGMAIAHQKRLERVCVEIREENLFCDIVSATPVAIITQLAGLEHLQSVRVNVGDGTRVETLLGVLAQLPKLEILDVCGSRAGGAPNLGLGMIHPNVHDEWFKVQHVALLYWRAQNALRYVRIHRCIFEYSDGIAQPRDGIDRWFDLKVRVGWEQTDDETIGGIAW